LTRRPPSSVTVTALLDSGFLQPLPQFDGDALLAGFEQDDVAGIGPQEQRLAAGFRKAADHADTPVDGLEAVADRAVSHRTAPDRRVEPSDRQMRIDQPGGEQHGARGHLLAVPANAKAVRGVLPQRCNAAGLQRGTVQKRLLAQARQQIWPGDSFESGIVVARRDQCRSTRAGIDEQRGPSIARKVNGGGQPGRSAADDQTVQHAFTPSGSDLNS
jgi:hypothetical protein